MEDQGIVAPVNQDMVSRNVKLLQSMGIHKPKTKERLLRTLKCNSKAVVYCDPLELLKKSDVSVPPVKVSNILPVVLNVTTAEKKLLKRITAQCKRFNQSLVYVGPSDDRWQTIVDQFKSSWSKVQSSWGTFDSTALTRVLHELRDGSSIEIKDSTAIMDDVYKTLLDAQFLSEEGTKDGKTEIKYNFPSDYILLCLKKIYSSYDEMCKDGKIGATPYTTLAALIKRVNKRLKRISDIMASKALLEAGQMDAATALNRSRKCSRWDKHNTSSKKISDGNSLDSSFTTSDSEESPERYGGTSLGFRRARSFRRSRSSSFSSDSRSRSRTPMRFRSRSRTRSRTPISSRSQTRSRTPIRSRSRSPIRSRSRTRSRTSVRSRSRSPIRSRERSRTRSRTPSLSRSRSRSKSGSPQRRKARSKTPEVTVDRAKLHLKSTIQSLCQRLLPSGVDCGGEQQSSSVPSGARRRRRGIGHRGSSGSGGHHRQGSFATDLTLDEVLRHLDELSVDDLTPIPENLSIEAICALECLEKMGSSKPKSKEGFCKVLCSQLKFLYYSSLLELLKHDKKLSRAIVGHPKKQFQSQIRGNARKRRSTCLNEAQASEDVFVKIGGKKVHEEAVLDREDLLEKEEKIAQAAKEEMQAKRQKMSRGKAQGQWRRLHGKVTKTPQQEAKMVTLKLPDPLKETPPLESLCQSMLKKQVLWQARRDNTIAIQADERQKETMKAEMKQLLWKLRVCQKEGNVEEDQATDATSAQPDEELAAAGASSKVLMNGRRKVPNVKQEVTRAELLAMLIHCCIKPVTYEPEYLVELLEDNGIVQFVKTEDANGEKRSRASYNLSRWEDRTEFEDEYSIRRDAMRNSTTAFTRVRDSRHVK